MKQRDFLDHLTPELRNMPGWQLIAEMLRVDAEFREVYMQEEGSAGFSTELDIARINEILAVLRSFADDSTRESIAVALAPFRR